MTPTKFNAVEDSGKMMRTLCLLFLAVGLSDYNIGDIKSPSMILLAVSMLVIISIQKNITKARPTARRRPKRIINEDIISKK